MAPFDTFTALRFNHHVRAFYSEDVLVATTRALRFKIYKSKI